MPCRGGAGSPFLATGLFKFSNVLRTRDDMFFLSLFSFFQELSLTRTFSYTIAIFYGFTTFLPSRHGLKYRGLLSELNYTHYLSAPLPTPHSLPLVVAHHPCCCTRTPAYAATPLGSQGAECGTIYTILASYAGRLRWGCGPELVHYHWTYTIPRDRTPIVNLYHKYPACADEYSF